MRRAITLKPPHVTLWCKVYHYCTDLFNSDHHVNLDISKIDVNFDLFHWLIDSKVERKKTKHCLI